MISSDEVSSFKPFLSETLRPRGPIANKSSQCSFIILILGGSKPATLDIALCSSSSEKEKPKGEVLLEKQADIIHFLECESGIHDRASFTQGFRPWHAKLARFLPRLFLTHFLLIVPYARLQGWLNGER
jgi:hypothetical protein